MFRKWLAGWPSMMFNGKIIPEIFCKVNSGHTIEKKSMAAAKEGVFGNRGIWVWGWGPQIDRALGIYYIYISLILRVKN